MKKKNINQIINNNIKNCLINNNKNNNNNNNIFINYNNYNFKIEEKNDENFLNNKRKTI
jgi:hypothetical protein